MLCTCMFEYKVACTKSCCTCMLSTLNLVVYISIRQLSLNPACYNIPGIYQYDADTKSFFLNILLNMYKLFTQILLAIYTCKSIRLLILLYLCQIAVARLSMF